MMVHSGLWSSPVRSPRSRSRRHRGVAAVAMMVVLVLMGLVLLGMVQGGARDQELTVQRLTAVQAFYAAEGAMNMAVREVRVCKDEDGDGDVGTISDDSNDATDPAIGGGRAAVTLVSDCPTSPTVTLTSRGRAGIAVRVAEATLEHR